MDECGFCLLCTLNSLLNMIIVIPHIELHTFQMRYGRAMHYFKMKTESYLIVNRVWWLYRSTLVEWYEQLILLIDH